MLLLGGTIRDSINYVKNKERVVTVKGLAEMEVLADKVIWPLMYKDISNDLSVLTRISGKRMKPLSIFHKNKKKIESSLVLVHF